MPTDRLENLVRAGDLIPEPPYTPDLARLLASATLRLADARRADLSFASRFDLAYNAAHAFALIALRRRGYRPRNRYIVFQLLDATAGMPATEWRVLALAHERRNIAEYEGALEEDPQLLADVVLVIDRLFELLTR